MESVCDCFEECIPIRVVEVGCFVLGGHRTGGDLLLDRLPELEGWVSECKVQRVETHASFTDFLIVASRAVGFDDVSDAGVVLGLQQIVRHGIAEQRHGNHCEEGRWAAKDYRYDRWHREILGGWWIARSEASDW
jgi:hypothetical protein